MCHYLFMYDERGKIQQVRLVSCKVTSMAMNMVEVEFFTLFSLELHCESVNGGNREHDIKIIVFLTPD